MVSKYKWVRRLARTAGITLMPILSRLSVSKAKISDKSVTFRDDEPVHQS